MAEMVDQAEQISALARKFLAEFGDLFAFFNGKWVALHPVRRTWYLIGAPARSAAASLLPQAAMYLDQDKYGWVVARAGQGYTASRVLAALAPMLRQEPPGPGSEALGLAPDPR